MYWLTLFVIVSFEVTLGAKVHYGAGKQFSQVWRESKQCKYCAGPLDGGAAGFCNIVVLPSVDKKEITRFVRADYYEEVDSRSSYDCRCSDVPNLYKEKKETTGQCSQNIKYCLRKPYFYCAEGYGCTSDSATYFCSCNRGDKWFSLLSAGQQCSYPVSKAEKMQQSYPPGLIDLLRLPGILRIDEMEFHPALYLAVRPNQKQVDVAYSIDGRHVKVRNLAAFQVENANEIVERLTKLSTLMPHALNKQSWQWLKKSINDYKPNQKIYFIQIYLDRRLRIELDAGDNVRPRNKDYKWRSIGRVQPFRISILSNIKGSKMVPAWYYEVDKLFVPYESHFLPCSFKITIRLRNIQCSDDMNKPTAIGLYRPLKFEAGYEPWFPTDDGTTSCKMKVTDHRYKLIKTIEKFNVNHTYTAHHLEEDLQPLKSKYSRLEFTLHKENFKIRLYLESKLYLLIYDVLITGHPDHHASGYEFTQRKLCYMTLPEAKDVKVYPAKRQEKVTCSQTYNIRMVNEDAVNFPNEDIEVDWTCSKLVHGSPATTCEAKTTKGIDPYETENLECNAVYTFNLTVYFLRNDSRYTLKSTHQVTYKSVSGPTKINIKCHGNCGTTLSFTGTIKLTAVENPKTNVPFTWKMYSLENGPDGETKKELSDAEVSRGRVPDLDDDVFLLHLKYFPKPQYTVVASTLTGEESYTFKINHGPPPGVCTISPKSGKMGKTNFTVKCENFNKGYLPITYKVVEMYPLSIYPVVSSLDEVMNDIILHHTNVSVIVTDARGASTQFPFPTLTLQPSDKVSQYLFDEFLKQINLKLLGNQNEEALEIMGELARRMASSKTEYIDQYLLQLLDSLSRVDTFDDAVDVQRGLGILNKVLESERRPASLRTDEVLLACAEQFLTLSDTISSMIDSEEMSYYERSLLVPTMLQGASLIMKTTDDVVTNDSLEEDDNERHIQRAKDSTVAVLEAMDKFFQSLGEEVNNTLDPYEKEVEGFDMKVAVGKLLSLSDDETTKGNEKSFNFSEEFLKANARSEVTLLKLTAGEKSVFWFMPESNVGLVDVAIQPVKESLSDAFKKEPLIVHMALDNLTSEYFEGILKPAPSCSCIKKDRSVSVLQLKLPDGEGIVLVKVPPRFMNNTKMVFQQGQRPVFDSFTNSSPANQEIVYQPYKNLNNLNESDFYVGLIPDSDLTVPTPYKLEVTVVRCAIWMGEHFENRGCKLQNIEVSPKKGGKRRITCNCTHHSWFSASLFLPPHKIVLADDLHLFSTIFDNFYVALLMFLIILFLIVILVWGYRKDRRDVADRYIITLEDNWPGETYPYVIAVFTGERLGSGTTSLVALRLWGRNGISRVHVLESSSRSVLKLGGDNWFLLKTPKSIGTLKSVQLWHNHSGPRPEWYCRRVVVYDIRAGQTYEFLVERWFTFDASCPVEEARFFQGYVATYEEISRKWYYHITGWAFSELRDKHHWASIFTRHPRSLYTRCQRVMIAVGLLTTTMLVSMMFFDVSVTGPADIPAARFTLTEFWIGLKSTIISIVLTTAVLWCFERSKKTSLLEIEKLQRAKEEPAPKVKLPFKKKVGKKIKEMAKKKVAPQPIPYQAVTFAADEERKKSFSVIIFLILGWVISTITLIVVTFFIILYGLKFGVKKSLVWILTFVSGTVSDTFLMEPLKMIALAVIVSLVFKKSNLENFTMKVKYSPVPETTETKLEKLRKLYHTRLQSHYSPYLTDWIKEYHHSRCSRKVKYLLVYGVFYTLMLILVGVFIYVIDEKVKFFYLRQVGYHFKETETVRTTVLTNESNQVLTKESMYKFFHFTAIPALHRVLWYNNKSLPLEKGEEEPNADKPRFASNVKGFAQGYTSKLLGVPRLRQMRMKKSDLFLMRVDKLFRRLYSKAIGNYIPLKEERKAHLPKWKPYDNSLGKLRQLWTYTKPFDTGTILGKTLLPYPGGGYFRYLDWNLGGSQRSLQNLEMNNWVDNFTRSIFLEMNLYNNNLKLFATIRLVTEALPCGFYSFRTQLQSASFFFEKNPESKAIVGLMFLLSLLLLGYGIFCFIQFSRIGFFNYMGTFRGFCDIVLLVCGIASVANYLQRALHFSLFIEYLDNAPHDKFISLYTPFQADEAAQNAFGAFTMMLTVSMGVNIVQIISIGRFSWVFSKIYESLAAALLLNVIFNCLLSYTSVGTIRRFFNFFFFQFTFKEERLGSFKDEENRWFFLICFPLIIVVMQFNVATIVYFYNTLETERKVALAIIQSGKHDDDDSGGTKTGAPKKFGRRKRREPMVDPEEANALQKKIDNLLVF